jgi:hypothetical protein
MNRREMMAATAALVVNGGKGSTPALMDVSTKRIAGSVLGTMAFKDGGWFTVEQFMHDGRHYLRLKRRQLAPVVCWVGE